jgi:hypothetical protein
MTSSAGPSPLEAPPSAAPLPHWRKLHAFGLPGGSIRALLAVAVFAGIWAWLWRRPDEAVPVSLQNLMFIIMGHYFAARAKKEAGPEPGPPPLFLPKGTVRVILVGGFVAVAAVLFYRRHLWLAGEGRLSEGGVTLILVGGFLLGVVANRVTMWMTERRRPPRIVEDVRAFVALFAAAMLLLMVFKLWTPPDELPQNLTAAQQFFVKYRPEDVLAAVVGFYFGSRS